nr:acyl-CoA dehydrogenase [Gammaproteobacteria bacterium]
MEFSLTQDHQLLSETARKVGEEFGLEYWRALDAKKEFAFDFWQKVCDMGLAGAAL